MDSDGQNPNALPDYYLAASLDMLRNAHQAHMLPIRGQSMRPFIQDGDQLLVIPGTTNIRRGDVILFQQGNQLFAHRVLIPSRPSGEPGLLTKGDNVLLPDPPVRLEQVIGRVAMIQRGNQQLSLETTTWRRLGHAIALMMLVASWLLTRARRVRQSLGLPGSSWLTRRMSKLARLGLQLILRFCQRVFSPRHML